MKLSNKIVIGAAIAVVAILANAVTTAYYRGNIGASFGGGSSFSNTPIIASDQSLNQASTTLCAIPVPTATSTVVDFILNITTSTSSQAMISVGTSTSPYATSSSMISTYTVAANTQATISWRPQYTGSIPAGLAYPRTYVVAGITNGSAVGYGYTYGGACKTLFNSPN